MTKHEGNRSMNLKHSILISFMLLCTSSCGFHPIYAKQNNPTRALMEEIEIVPVSTIEGADFYNHMMNIIPHGTNKKYSLETSFQFSKDISLIQQNSDILRETITISVSYYLKEIETDKRITSGNFNRLSSFNTTFSPYSNLVQQQDIQKNLSIMSAEEVRNRVMLFLENRK